MPKQIGFLHDARSIKARDPAARSLFEVILLYPGFHAVFWHRIAHRFFSWNMKLLARMVSQTSRFLTGIEIHPGAKIGRGLFIDHGMGVVIGETAEIGDNCTIYQGVTLGGTGKDEGKRHPTLGNNVLIGAGAKVLGPFKVGDNARIGAGAVVLNEVGEGSTVAGIKARVVKKKCKGKKMATPSEDLDQIHIADPISLELCKVRSMINELDKRLVNISEEAMRRKKDEDI